MKYVLLLTIILLSAFSYGEGVKGGGETHPSRPTTPDEVIESISRVKTPLRYVLKKMEGAHSYTDQSGRRWYEELYAHKKGEPSIYQLIHSLKFIPKIDGPCLDKVNKNEPKDGSAFNENPNEICLSVDGILKSANGDNVLAKTVALAAHEVVHRKFGTDPEVENVANSLQTQVEWALLRAPPFQNTFENMAKWIDDGHIKYTLEFLDSHDKFPGETKCNYIGILGARFEPLDREITKSDGYAIVSQAQRTYFLSGMEMRSSLMHSYCMDENFENYYPEAKQYWQEMFPGTTLETTLKQAAIRRNKNKVDSYTVNYPDAPLHRVRYHNDADFKLELSRLRAQLVELRKLMQAEVRIAAQEALEATETAWIWKAARRVVDDRRRKESDKAKPVQVKGCRNAEQILAAATGTSTVDDFDARSLAIEMTVAFKLDKVDVVASPADKSWVESIKDLNTKAVSLDITVVDRGIRYRTNKIALYKNDPRLGQIVRLDMGKGSLNWKLEFDRPWVNDLKVSSDPQLDRSGKDTSFREWVLPTQEGAKFIESERGTGAQWCDSLIVSGNQ